MTWIDLEIGLIHINGQIVYLFEVLIEQLFGVLELAK